MPDVNYFEIIKTKLDALVDRIIQRETSDENFRITYAQILEKINTKMDIFSSSDEAEKIELLRQEVCSLICEKNDAVDNRLAAMLKDFEELNEEVKNGVQATEIAQAFQNVQKQIKYFSEEIESQRAALNNTISYMEKFGTLDNTNRFLESEFNIVKGQNAIINDTLVNQLQALNKHSKEYDAKFIEVISTINADLNDLLEQNKMYAQKGDTNLIFNKIEELTLEFENSKGFVLNINNNLMTLIDVVDNMFQNEDFEKIQVNIGNIIANTTILSEAIKKLGTKDDLEKTIAESTSEIKEYNEELINALEEKLLSKIDFSSLDTIKDYTEKMFYQGTEVLKEEIWTIKDTLMESKEDIYTIKDTLTDSKEDISSIKATLDESKEDIETIVENVTETNENISEIKDSIGTKLDRLRDEVADTLSKESIAKAYQFENITDVIVNKQAEKIEEAKEEITDIISAESIAASNQISALNSIIDGLKNESLTAMQKQFVTQMIQVAENISFVEEAEELHDHIYDLSDELKEKISQDIHALKSSSENNAKDLTQLLEKINERITGASKNGDYIYTLPDVESDLSKIRLDLNNITKTLISSENLTDENITDIHTSINKLKLSIDNLENNPIADDVSEVKGLFDELNEDISSISKRTNKLILTSDEVNKTLQRHIDEFTKIVGEFDSVVKKYNDDALIISLHRKIENLTRLSNSLVSSDKVLNEAFMYLAEWIDGTSDSFEEIKENITEINGKIDTVVQNDEQAGLLTGIDNLTVKVDEQEAKLVLINEKLDSLLNQKAEDSEIKSLLEFIASQISAANEKITEHDKMAQRVENMEKQLKKIEKNVCLLASYIEEED